jgi:hypothetical protein
MSYKKWNTALIDYYFNNNAEEEVILYCDEEIINEIGVSSNLGLLPDFINCVLADEEGRRTVFDSFFNHRNGKVSLNKKIISSHNLDFSIVLHETGIEKKISMTFFSCIITSILKNTLNTDSESYTKLQKLKNPTGYDELFKSIEKIYPKFINRKIGKHRYDGLIKFQAVLTKKENIEIEDVLYRNQLEFSEYESYETILNRVIRYCDGKLREKLQLSAKDECYKIWFENKFKNFRLESYQPNDKSDINISVEGEFALAFVTENDFRGLQLLTNVNPKSTQTNNGITILRSEINSKLENGYFPNSVRLENEESINLNEYKFEFTSDKTKTKIKSLSLQDIILLQKINSNFHIQTEHPYPNTETFILVKNDTKAIDHFKKLCNEKNINTDEIPFKNTIDIFGKNHILFISNNVTEPFYKKSFFEIRKNNDLIKKIGGYKPKGTVNTYLDVALPQFKLNISSFEENQLKISYLRKDLNNKEDKTCFGYSIDYETITVFIKDLDFQFESINIQINFEYNKIEIGSFDFLIESSKMKPMDIENDYVKLDKWGKETTTIPYYNILSLKGADAVNINGYRQLINFQENIREYSDYFIHLLSATFYKRDKNYIEKHQLKEIYQQALRFLNSKKGIDIPDSTYSYNNLLKYLVDLGFLQRKIIQISSNPKECYLLIVPTFTRIENSFTHGGSQIYILTGIYSRQFSYLLKSTADTHNIKINYKTRNSELEKLAENILLPDLVLIDNKFPFDEFKKICIENGLDFVKEDEHNIANSLLNFTASIGDFENIFKNQSSEIIQSNSLESIEKDLKPSEENFPRLRVIDTTDLYKAKTYFVEMEKDKFFKYHQPFSSKWLSLYLKNKRKDPLIIYRKKKSNATDFRYYPEIYLYKYDQFPTLVTKSLALLNNGIPSEKKIFITNSRFNENSKGFAFNIFLEYKISDDVDRRKNLAKILTGSENLENNDQIIDSVYFDNNPLTMELFTLKSFCFEKTNKFILIKRDDNVIAVLVLGNYSKPQSIFLASEILASEINIDTTIHQMVKIEMTEDVNAIISAVIKNDVAKIINYQSTINNCFIPPICTEDYNNEPILIIDNF